MPKRAKKPTLPTKRGNAGLTEREIIAQLENVLGHRLGDVTRIKINGPIVGLHLGNVADLEPVIPILGQLRDLTDLTFLQCSFTSIPPAIETLTRLQYLSIEDTPLSTISAEIGNLPSLDKLVLMRNNFNSFPETITGIKNLQKLEYWENNLAGLPPSIQKLENLKDLAVGFNKLATLPDEFGQLKSLQRLNIIHNQFTSFPACLGRLPALKYINASYNQLEHLLPSLSLQLHGELNLANNHLQTLPDSLAGSPIARLCLARNQFRHVPLVVRKFPYLYYLDLQENPLENMEGLTEEKINLGVDMKWREDPALSNFYLFTGRYHCPLCYGTEELDN